MVVEALMGWYSQYAGGNGDQAANENENEYFDNGDEYANGEDYGDEYGYDNDWERRR
jgi:hypothetical protein